MKSQAQPTVPTWACVGAETAIPPGSCKRVVVQERDVVVFHLREGGFHCIDAACYHTGGPLPLGDIENADQRCYVVCPWHRYKIDLKTGEGLLVDPSSGRLKSKGKRQRTHEIKVENGALFVKISVPSSHDEKLASDDYAYMELYKNQAAVPKDKTRLHSFRV